jgi:aryl-alcohol dehydrogenase-like predicted oxidoreductase/RimJ/RimL family protein N-acetyltransferase
MIKSERFLIRPLKPDDVTQTYLGWFNDHTVKRYITTAFSTQSIQCLREFVTTRMSREDVLFLGIFVIESGAHIGNIKFEPINIKTKSAVMGILIGDKGWRARGVSPEVLDACINWLYLNRGIETVILGVDKENSAAIRAYKKAGFVTEPPQGVGNTQNSTTRMVRRYIQNAQRLALGTVQFGLSYGIANRTGQVRPFEIDAILSCAKGAGVNTVDTAIAYGSSEENLGQYGVRRWKVISKLPPLPAGLDDIRKWVNDAVINSLNRLQIDNLEGLLLHRSSDFIGHAGEQLNKALLELKDQGLVKKIGVSIYDPHELEALFGRRQIDLVQAPFNVVDRRMLTSGWMARLFNSGVELHTRSAFLQGLLLSEKLQRDPRFCKWGALWFNWNRWLKEEDLSPLQACLGFSLSRPEIHRVVVGVDTRIQLTEILGALQIGKISPPDSLISIDLDLIHPSRWVNAK